MLRPGRSSPTPVGDLLVAALPALAEPLLLRAVAREWERVVGPEAARRARPGDLRGGTLTVLVDNSPWLQELTLRAGEVLARLQARHGRERIAAVHFSLGGGPRP